MTILVSLMTQPKPESELQSLVYGLTELPREEGVKWYPQARRDRIGRRGSRAYC